LRVGSGVSCPCSNARAPLSRQMRSTRVFIGRKRNTDSGDSRLGPVPALCRKQLPLNGASASAQSLLVPLESVHA
jgi:hypothetical protein